MKTPKNNEEDPEAWKQQMEEILKWKTPLITVFTHTQGEVFSINLALKHRST
jgi:hypothetical protein